MGHHHRKDKTTQEKQTAPSNDSNALNNVDFSSMLGNLNLDNVDLSKIDMNKVKSIMDRIRLPEGADNSGSSNGSNGLDPRINLINSLKELMPSKRARTMDNISKFLQLSQILNNSRNFSRK